MPTILMTGDVNLMNVADPHQPFRQIRETLQAADLVVSNLECTLFLPPRGNSLEHEGFFADPDIGAQALQAGGIDIVGIANNVNYGEAAILGSIETLRRYGIQYAGAGANRAAARKPAIVEKGGVRYGFLQRSSVYWATNHEAGAADPGIAVIRGHTAYQVPLYRDKPGRPPFNRPGVPPEIVTWADRAYLDWFAEDIAALKRQVDIVIASCHWGLAGDVLEYMTQIARTAIDAGADIVFGHGPHQPLPIGCYKEKPIFYGLGSFSFHTGHQGIKHGDWIGILARLDTGTSFSFVRHNAENETVAAPLAEEGKTFNQLKTASLPHGAVLTQTNGVVVVTPIA
jgi:poly-gamma-glutamate synthesis protein (capsule biosynthesis protein)